MRLRWRLMAFLIAVLCMVSCAPHDSQGRDTQVSLSDAFHALLGRRLDAVVSETPADSGPDDLLVPPPPIGDFAASISEFGLRDLDASGGESIDRLGDRSSRGPPRCC